MQMASKLKLINMETHATKTFKAFLKIIGFLGCTLLTLFAGMFGMVTMGALVQSIVNPTVFSFIGCVGSGFITWVLWSIRKDTLV